MENNIWKEHKFEEIMTITSSKRIFYEEYVQSGVPFYRSKEIIDLFNRRDIQTELFISEKRFDEIKNKFGVPSKDDILLTSVGSLGIPYLVKESDRFYFKDGNLTWLKDIDSNILLPVFIYKWITSQIGRQKLEEISIGSTQAALTISGLKSIEIQLPPLPEQKAIASVLSSLDDKIDLLHQQNQTLEALAETLFRQWFIERCPEPVEGEAKEDWEEVSLGSIIDLVVDNRGKTPPTVDYKTTYPLIEVNAINTSDCLVNYNVIRKYVVEETYNSWFRKHLKVNDVIVSTVGTIGVFSIFTSNIGCIAQNLIGLRSDNISPYFIYLFLKINKEDILNLDIGGVQPSIKVPHLMDLKFKKPNIEVIHQFHELVKEYFNKIGANQQQIQTLTQLRDTLLPKLMSGEVRVKN